jgi:CRP-like cAMP-binding protein
MSALSNEDLLKRVPLFGQLTPDQVRSLASTLAKQRFKRNEHVVDFGQRSNALFIILAGRARVILNNDKGREVILATLSTGDYFGEMSLIDNEPHSATVLAEVQLDVLVLTRDGFLRCMLENPAMTLSVMRGLVQRIRHTNQQVASFALKGVYGRVANILLSSAVKRDDGALIIPDKISHMNIAKMVGSSREMVSRAMKDFEAQAFIEKVEGGGLRIYERRATAR